MQYYLTDVKQYDKLISEALKDACWKQAFNAGYSLGFWRLVMAQRTNLLSEQAYQGTPSEFETAYNEAHGLTNSADAGQSDTQHGG
jgi:hypothetical protein